MERLIIFDCDGTLVDSETISMQVMIEYAAELGAEMSHQEALARFAGKDLKLVIQEIEPHTSNGIPDDFIPEFRRRQYLALRTRLQPIEGALELVSQLREPFCVASNAPPEKIQICLETTKLIDHFAAESIFSAYQVNAWKPNPKLFLAAADAFGVPVDKCIVVEDSIFGIDAGIAAGMQVVAFDPERELKPKLKGTRSVVHVIKHLSELEDLLAIDSGRSHPTS